MNISNNIINPAFRGYKNVITNDIEYPDGSRLAFITMQLNDEGDKDLTQLHEIRKFIPEQQADKSDVLTFMYSKFRRQPEYFFFDGRSMYLGDELLRLSEECGDTYNYKREETAAMKAYTLMASLTKRMMNGKMPVRDSGMGNVIQKMAMHLSEGDTKKLSSVMNFLSYSLQLENILKPTAAFFEDFVLQNMSKFFQMKL